MWGKNKHDKVKQAEQDKTAEAEKTGETVVKQSIENVWSLRSKTRKLTP